MKIHPLAEIFPAIQGDELDELITSIRENGLRHPITVYDDMILDGRNRYRACQEAGVEPRFEAFTGSDPVRFVVDVNIHRRHLKTSQRAIIAAQLVTTNPFGGGNPTSQIYEVTLDEAARRLNVSAAQVSLARTVLRDGTPSEIESVRNGEVTASLVAKQLRAKLPAEKRTTDAGAQRTRTIQEQAAFWHMLRVALENLTSLPRASDLIAVARSHDKKTKGAAIQRKLIPSLEWLQEFKHEWESGNGNSR